jgi:serine/threonine-protein kinase
LTVIRERYRLDALIGEGGMASVWRAWDLTLQRPIAVKLLFARESHTEEALVDRFLREARIAASVQHRNVIHIVDFGTTADGQPFMVMELLEGETLAARLRRQKPLPVADVVQIGHLTLRGLSAVHAAGIIHRDLKPENVYLKDEGGVVYPKILDFGISRSIEPAHGPRSALTTREGVIVGTPEYMSPEQARGVKQLDYRTDLYSMGVVLYEALTGQLPYTSENVGDLIIKIVTGCATSAHELVPGVPREISDVVARAMARQPGDRYRDALEMQEALLLAANRASSHTLLPIFSDLPPEPSGKPIADPPRSPRPARTLPRTQAVRMQMLAPVQPANQVTEDQAPATLPPLPAAPATLPPSTSPGFAIIEATPLPSLVPEPQAPPSDLEPLEAESPLEASLSAAPEPPPETGAEGTERAPFSTRPTEPNLSTPATETTGSASSLLGARPWLLPAAAAALLVFVGGAVLWLAPRPPPRAVSTPASPPIAASSRVTLQLRGLPAGAVVRLDGQPAGERLQLPADGRTRSLAVEARGKKPWQLSFVPQGDQVLDVALEDLPPTAAPTPAAASPGRGSKKPTKRPTRHGHGVLRVPDF